MWKPVDSRVFRRYLGRAAAMIAKGQPLGRLIAAASALLGRNPAALRRLGRDATALVRMCREVLTGHYREVPRRTLVAAVAALIYMVDPLDLIPDVLPAIGLLDDAFVLAWVVRQVRRDIDTFLVWEAEWGHAVDVDATAVPLDALPLPAGHPRA
jgi:uncharacterized membrane protein YkvA (DUF1232 family)